MNAADSAAGPPDPTGSSDPTGSAARPRQRQARARKQVLLRLDPAVHDALARWANDELRSANAQIEFLLRKALADAGRLPRTAGPIPRRGRPARPAEEPSEGPSEGPGPTETDSGPESPAS